MSPPVSPPGSGPGLRVLVVDDEAPVREELGYLLERDPRVAAVRAVGSSADALKALDAEPVDVLFLDIRMPGLGGLDLARTLARFRDPPRVVFVTAYEEHAVEAFDLQVADYLLKPVREERLAEAVRRVCDGRTSTAAGRGADGGGGGGDDGGGDGGGGSGEDGDETIAVELAGVTRFVWRSEVRFVETQGDYARLFTATGSHLLRVPLTTLEEQWSDAGFVRIHRSHLVALRHIDEVRVESGRCTVRLGDDVLQVSRRHTRDLRDRLVHRARRRNGTS